MRLFMASENNDQINNVKKDNKVNSSKWKAADQLAIHKHGWGFELRTTKNNTS